MRKGLPAVLRDHWQNWQQRRVIAGFDYAAGQLLRGISPEALRDMTHDPPNQFDHGVLKALTAWRRRP